MPVDLESGGKGESADYLSTEFQMLIGGEMVASPKLFDVVDPATGNVVARSPVAGPQDVARAVGHAADAFVSWRATSFADRVAVVRAIVSQVTAHAEELAQIVTLESGKRLEEARVEPLWAEVFGQHFSSLDIAPTEIYGDENGRVDLHWQPLGVVAAIVPWNFPLHEAMYKVLPAILAGNTVVLKPAPTTPLSAMKLGELVRDHVPAGVLNIVGDDGSVGPLLVDDPRVAGVTFTGSTAAGRSIMTSAANDIKRVLLELGGNDAAIVLDDVDVAAVAEQIFSGSFYYAGQVCACIKRIYAHSSIYDELCGRLAELAKGAKLGSGLDPDTTMVPLQNAAQFERARRWMALAHQDGTVVAGGSVVDGPGYFVEPTIVRDIADDSAIVSEETFGPIRPVLSYDDVDDAIERANRSPYGLGGSVWSRDISRAEEVARRLECGTVWINQHAVLNPAVPFGGHKASGLGAEFGADALKEYMNAQAIFVPKS